MKLYLKYSDNTYTDAADYEGIPFDAPQGAQWVEGDPEGLEVKKPPLPLDVQLNKIISTGQDLLKNDPLPTIQRLEIYQFASQAVIAAQHNDLQAVQELVQMFNPEGLSEFQSETILALKSQINQLIQEVSTNV